MLSVASTIRSPSTMMKASFSRLPCLPAPSRLARRLFSSEQDYKVGTVVFYARHRAYGFVRPDGSDDDVFVHRNNFDCSVPGSVNSANPFLKKGERVRFRLAEEDNRHRAVDVTYEDGTPLPVFREEYLQKQTGKIYQRFGQNVFDVLGTDGSENEHYQQILKAFYQARDEIVKNQIRAHQSAEMKPEKLEPEEQEEVAQEEEEEKTMLPKSDLE